MRLTITKSQYDNGCAIYLNISMLYRYTINNLNNITKCKKYANSNEGKGKKDLLPTSLYIKVLLITFTINSILFCFISISRNNITLSLINFTKIIYYHKLIKYDNKIIIIIFFKSIDIYCVYEIIGPTRYRDGRI